MADLYPSIMRTFNSPFLNRSFRNYVICCTDACQVESVMVEHHVQNPFHHESYTFEEDCRSSLYATLLATSFKDPADLMPSAIVCRHEAGVPADSAGIQLTWVASDVFPKSGSTQGGSMLNSSKLSAQMHFGHHGATRGSQLVPL